MSGAVDRQRLYGLVVESELDLHQNRPARPDEPADVRVRWGAPRARRLQGRPVEGALLLDSGSRRYGYVIVERPDGTHLLRFFGACDAEISADLADVTVHPVVGADPGIGVVLATGAVLAYLLVRRGHLVLHGSAVAVDGGAVAFVAPSGGGKSTMATLLCADGAGLVTDDVLRVDLDGPFAPAPSVRSGATGLRLRKGADTLVGLFSDGEPGRHVSADQRQVLTPPGEVPDALPLRAVVVPVPEPGLDALSVERVDPKQAAFDLLGFPRLLGWRDPAYLTRHLAEVAALVARVPVLRARVPWGPPFSPRIAPDLRAAVAEHADAERAGQASGR
ncbi:phosphoenolpyruvate carboxykinase (ATP) [Actinotalea fermentans]|uniref:HPr kinase n=1 Tax=Actinotalea fermentans TaxID=43671 RepID=A0A511YWY6_9CELL|nr:hypothetical protein [Actinotalea fermentans]KGM15059.1 hypothetical protein N867_12430 [Actinotalea fermentans ATCC 43279 = JCM 9966 = DSM 3133]GEN79705.1 hypothetical protein AFE02nite_14390 [Actinotalea fermentans]